MSTNLETGIWVQVCSSEELERVGVKVISGEGRPVAVFFDQGKVYALDNRCPHMGFPLHRGTVNDGILTCHWHHAKFDLAGGCTFDPFADDVASFPVEVRGEDVWLRQFATFGKVAESRIRRSSLEEERKATGQFHWWKVSLNGFGQI